MIIMKVNSKIYEVQFYITPPPQLYYHLIFVQVGTLSSDICFRTPAAACSMSTQNNVYNYGLVSFIHSNFTLSGDKRT
jgi:hypothetical protein